MVFVRIGEHDFVNVDQIARCEFITNVGNRYQGNIYLAKPGGSDRHFVYDQAAHDLEEVLKTLAPSSFGLDLSTPKQEVKLKAKKKS